MDDWSELYDPQTKGWCSALKGDSEDQLGSAREESMYKLCTSRPALVDIMATQTYDDELASQGVGSNALCRYD